MISAQSRPYIEASVPVLREHGVTITRTFYKNMFAAHPEFTNLFNMGNQANGSQQQSLASAVFAYAANFGNPDVLAPVISRIVHKHVSVGITADHYPIVGHHLLGAIQETLGEAATPPLLDAWGEAYGLLADALISEEKRLYDSLRAVPGALRKMRIIEARQQSDLVTSFKMKPLDEGIDLSFKPGQYMSVAADFPDGQRQLRQYSLSDAPGKEYLRISVKREPAGDETPAGRVSNWLHENLRIESTLEVSAPCGDFTPDTDGKAPIVLLSAGIGITPMISTLNRIAEINPQREVVFGYATRDKHHHSHRSDIGAAQKVMPNLKVVTFYENCGDVADENISAGFMRLDKLPQWEYSSTNVYLCGPIKFMQIQWQNLINAGAPASLLHREVFGPEMLDHLL
jgi:nitric oxide dioxygenase